MMFTHMKAQLKERLDHIEKHLNGAREQFDILDSDAPLREKLQAALDLTNEFEVIQGDAARALLTIGEREVNEHILNGMKD